MTEGKFSPTKKDETTIVNYLECSVVSTSVTDEVTSCVVDTTEPVVTVVNFTTDKTAETAVKATSV